MKTLVHVVQTIASFKNVLFPNQTTIFQSSQEVVDSFQPSWFTKWTFLHSDELKPNLPTTVTKEHFNYLHVKD